MVPVVANVLAQPISDPAEIVRALVAQVTGTVRWRELVAFMAGQGVTTFYEVGAGKVLSGLVKRIAEGASGVAIGTPDDVRRSRRRTGLNARLPERPSPEARSVMFDLTGKTALVTGATGGIGGAIARAFHHQGATVAISGTRRELLDQLAGELKERVHVLPCNLADKDEVEALVPKAEEAMGQLDILVANAGITKDNLFVQLRDEDWDEVVAVNLTATFRLARAAVRGMMRRRFGRIIGITSVVGVTGNPGQSNYTATKAGMIGMIKSVAARICQARRDRERDRAGLHRHGHDRQAQRQAARGDPRPGTGGPARRRRRRGGGGGLSRLRRGGLCHRPDPACERRNGDDLNATRVACWRFRVRRGRAGQAI